MATKHIDDLRDHLFETIAALRNKEDPMDLDRARAVADVGKVIIESAKVEVAFLKATGAAQGTGFIPMGIAPAPAVRRSLGPAPVVPAGDACVLCGVRLTSTYHIERGLCGSCSERP